MKFKRLMALAMAGLLTFAMAGSVYAAPEDETTAESEAAGEDVSTNPLSGDIIKKTLKLNEGVTIPAETFTFTFTSVSTNPEGITAPKIPNVTIAYSDADTYSANGIVKTAKIATVPTFAKSGEYVYTIKETAGSTTGMTYDQSEYTLRVYKKFGQDPVCTIQQTKDSAGEAVTDADKVATADFTNTYEPVTTLTINKTVEHPEWATVDSYDFAVAFETTGISKLDGKKVKVDGTEKDIASIGTITLKDGGSAVISDVPAGIKYTVTETISDETNYKETKITVKNGDTAENPVTGKIVTGNVSENATVVDVVNTFNDITVTGLALNIAPFVAMFAAVAGAIALYVAAKRHVR